MIIQDVVMGKINCCYGRGRKKMFVVKRRVRFEVVFVLVDFRKRRNNCTFRLE